ncbi:MAG: FAD-dependent thymidylate synthase [Chloroflexi bacterium]|nr:FAD-dependent thymidylate synthase [Chloroflexota bacterium]
MVKWSYTPRVQIVGRAARNPEAITAGMARISRDPTPVPQLIKEARDNTALARQRNQRVVYEYGHNSVAEHGCFSAAIWDIPRLLSLEIVRHRLAAYTQHSGRYIPFEEVQRQFYLPKEYRRGKARRLFEEAVSRSYAAYREIYAGCTAYLLEKYPRMRAASAERRATEDARYVLPLAQTTQVGVTTNAREFALMMTRLLSSPLPEFRATGEKLFAQLHPIAPSLFPKKYIHALPYPQSGLNAIQEVAATLGIVSDHEESGTPRTNSQSTASSGDPVRLVRYDPDGERHVAAALLFHGSQLTLTDAQQAVASLDAEQAGQIIRSAYRGLHAHDTILREFELLHYQFELVMSEAAYHQFIRHRMKTEVSQAHSPAHGRTLPPLVRNAGFADDYKRTLDLLEGTFHALGADQRAEIVLANGHNLRILADLNAREVVEMSRIRSDRHAQWDIRNVSDAIVAAVKRVHPHVGLACGGRDSFKDGTAAVLPDTVISP